MSMQISNNTLASVEEYVLKRLQGIYSDREGANIFSLACHSFLGMNQIDIRINKGVKLSESEMVKFIHLTKRLRLNEPIQYILNKAFFFNFELEISKDTLIPRPETEELVEWVIADEKSENRPRIIDVGTGSGCIALGLKEGIPKASVQGIDISSGAIEVASRNAGKYHLDIDFTVLDILKEDIPGGNVDVIVSNPPYIGQEEAKDMNPNVLDFEPKSALFPEGEDVLVFYSRIAELAQHQKARVYVEINRAYGEEVCALFDTFGALKTYLRKDISGNNRMVKAIW